MQINITKDIPNLNDEQLKFAVRSYWIEQGQYLRFCIPVYPCCQYFLRMFTRYINEKQKDLDAVFDGDYYNPFFKDCKEARAILETVEDIPLRQLEYHEFSPDDIDGKKLTRVERLLFNWVKYVLLPVFGLTGKE